MSMLLLLVVELAARWTNVGPLPGKVRDVTVAAGPDPFVFAVADVRPNEQSAIFRSPDGGRSWSAVTAPPPEETFIGVGADPHDADRVFAASFWWDGSGEVRLYRSVDGGATWSVRHTADPTQSCEFAFDPVASGISYVTCAGTSTVYRSLDGGETFADVAAPGLSTFLDVASDGAVVAGAGMSTFVSRDHGETWTATALPPLHCEIQAVAVDPTNPNRWLVGSARTLFSCGEIARTEDGGKTWAPPFQSGLVSDLLFDPSRPGLLYASTYPPYPVIAPSRVLVTSDGGESWNDLGLPVTPVVSSLAMPENGSRLYAATANGLYASDLRTPRTLAPRDP